MMDEKTITRADLIDALIERVGVSRSEASDVLEATLDLIVGQLSKGQDVKLSRFGNFTVRAKRARIGRNPKTGEEAEISPRTVVSFRPSQLLRERVAKGLIG